MCTDSSLPFCVHRSKKIAVKTQETKRVEIHYRFEAKATPSHAKYAEKILIFSRLRFPLAIHHPSESPPMIHEKLKATNSNEFIIENMNEISKRVFVSSGRGEKL